VFVKRAKGMLERPKPSGVPPSSVLLMDGLYHFG